VRTLLIDNYDSYTFNLFHVLGEIAGEEPLVVRNDETTWARLTAERFDNVVISPGPGRPDRARDVGLSRDAIRFARVPVLGVCLGHQLLAHVFGGSVARATHTVHGIRSPVRHDGRGLFAGLPQEFAAVRYHSLLVQRVPPTLRITAITPDGVIMGLAHRARDLWGVQFHPESVCTDHGRALLANFLARATGEVRRAPSGRRPSPGGSPARHRRMSASPGVAASVLVASVNGWCEPSALFDRLFAERDHVVWLDSAQAETERARFSFIAVPDGPLGRVVRYRAADSRLIIDSVGGRRQRREGILAYCRRELERIAVDPAGIPVPFSGGFAGYFGYELRRDCGARRVRTAAVPDATLLLCDRVLAFDHLSREVILLALADPRGERDAAGWLRGMGRRIAALSGVPAPIAGPPASPKPPFVARDSPEHYLANIAACQREIAAGESYEICLTTEFRTPAELEPVGIYRRLRAQNPAPYGALLRLGRLSVLSSSPERFLRIGRDRIVESKPIKGTAPRDPDPGRDAELARRLGDDVKTRAENLMIADLVRHDLGRVAELGSVEVPRLMAVESYSTVHQLVTTVRARLRDSASPVDCIRAAFPGGSMTGAPKLRTMEIIDRLERRARGVYSGALGYLSADGAADLSIVIRTLVTTPGGSSVGAGGAITALSDPQEEVQEMMLKAAPVIRAAGGMTVPSRPPRSKRLPGRPVAVGRTAPNRDLRTAHPR
jgi:para-aminobenzoate synthetase